jgi:hypothetical protein
MMSHAVKKDQPQNRSEKLPELSNLRHNGHASGLKSAIYLLHLCKHLCKCKSSKK